MMNVYINPLSTHFLSNVLFKKDVVFNMDDRLLFWRYLKDYLSKKNINLNTIDFWNEKNSNPGDVYVAFNHKNLFRRFILRLKNKNYPTVKLNKFKKRILFQSEPPLIMPEVYANIGGLSKIYDKLYFTLKIDNPKCRYFHIPRPYNGILPDLWKKNKRKFLVMINMNKKPPFFHFLRFYQNKKFYPLEKELIGERLKAIEFFSRTKELDLYGLGWEEPPPFPYWSFQKAVQKVYKKGWIDSKYQKLSEYKFTIAFENNISPGFIGEALFDCFYVGTIPIYLGASDIEKYIPKECFIDMRDFKNYEELGKYLKSLSEKEIEAYRERGKKFLESDKYTPFTKEHFAKTFLEAIIS